MFTERKTYILQNIYFMECHIWKIDIPSKYNISDDKQCSSSCISSKYIPPVSKIHYIKSNKKWEQKKKNTYSLNNRMMAGSKKTANAITIRPPTSYEWENKWAEQMDNHQHSLNPPVTTKPLTHYEWESKGPGHIGTGQDNSEFPNHNQITYIL